MDVTKKDWKLFQSRIGDWQENYMDKLTKEYIDLLSSSAMPSERFWKLYDRIKQDKRHPGVFIQLSKSNMFYDVVFLIRDGVISFDDLEDFSDEFKEAVSFRLRL